MARLFSLLKGDPHADRAVPPSGFTVRLTIFTSAAMAFLAVFALALTLTTGRVAQSWSEELARTSTLRISAPEGQMQRQVAAALAVLETTPGVAQARALSDDEQRELLAPWFGPDLPLETLPIPRLIEIVEAGEGYDATGLRARLQGEVPGAVLDDHARWREPLIDAADRLRSVGWLALALILGAMAAMISLAAQSALIANAQVIRVMRLVGARDVYIARAFVRRFTIRTLIGAALGVSAALALIAVLPGGGDPVTGGFLTGIGFAGLQWALPVLLPLLAAIIAFAATRAAAFRTLRGQS